MAVRRAVHRQEKVRQERLRRDERVVPTHAFGSKGGLELPLDAVVVVARRRALRVAVRAAVMARVEEHVPQAAQRRERIIGPAVPFMVPVVVVRHLGERQSALGRVHYIKSAREARVLLQRFADAEQPRRDEHGKGQRHDDRGTHLADERIKKVVGPVVHVGRARQGRLREMVQRVDVSPQKFIHV